MVCLRNSWRSLKCEDNAILLVVDRLAAVQKLSSLLKLSSTPWCPSQLENQHFCSDIPAAFAVGEQGRCSKPYLSGLSPFGDFLKTERSGRTQKGSGRFVLSVSMQSGKLTAALLVCGAILEWQNTVSHSWGLLQFLLTNRSSSESQRGIFLIGWDKNSQQ